MTVECSSQQCVNIYTSIRNSVQKTREKKKRKSTVLIILSTYTGAGIFMTLIVLCVSGGTLG